MKYVADYLKRNPLSNHIFKYFIYNLYINLENGIILRT